MKIAALIDERGERWGGYLVIAKFITEAIRAQGAEPILVCNRSAPGQPFRSFGHGCARYRVGVGRLGSWFGRLIGAAQLAWVLRRERVGLAHFHSNGLDLYGFFLVHAATRLPFVLTLHNFEPERLRRCGWEHPLILRFLLRRAVRVTAVSQAVAAPLRTAYPELAGKIRVVPNALVREPAGAESEPRRSRPYILSAGLLAFHKGTDLLLFAFHALLPKLPEEVDLVLCGEDHTGLFDDLIRRLGLSHRVRRVGPKPHDEVLSLMRGCLFYVCPSRQESFGLALLEAMSEGKAVVAPRTGGVPEYVEHDVNGLLFVPGDSGTLAAAMEKLAGGPDARERLGRRAGETAQRFVPEKIGGLYREVYHEALASAA